VRSGRWRDKRKTSEFEALWSFRSSERRWPLIAFLCAQSVASCILM
jgi:hypothetical protein